jgi:hypothetical protein
MTTTDLKSGVVGELGAKSPVLVATMVNITLSGEQTVNGVAVVEGDNVLVNGQTDQTQNGVYVVSTSAWTRAVWFNNELNAVSGTLILTTSGTQYPNTLWEVVCADAPIVFGTSEITFNFFQKSGAGGTPLLVGNNLNDVASASASRTNLGLAIGTDVQAQNANLSALAGLTGAANKIPQFTGVGAMSLLTTGIASGNVPLVGTQSATTSLAGTSLLLSAITLSNNISSPNTDIDFSSGVFQFADGSGKAAVSALTKKLNANWVAGTNQGGLDTGSKANSTWYHCYGIYNPTTLTSDFLFSTGATTPTTLPSGYTKFKRVGSVKTNGSGNIIGFLQSGFYFFLKSPVLEFSDSSTTTAALVTLTTPLGIKAISILSTTAGTAPGSTKIVRIFSPDATDATPDASNTNGGYIQTSGSTTDVYLGSGNILVPTNTSSQVYHRASVSTSITINTQGWIDNGIL